jgi:mono/diheme cytochrome c family protein
MPEVQWMPDLVVASAAGAPVRAQSRFPLPAALAAAGGLAAILLFALRRSLPAPVRTGSLLVGSALLVGAALLAVAPSLQNQAQAAQPSQPAGAQLGRDLFLAKGCIVCHVNSRAKAASLFSSGGEIPDLSAYHNDPVFLRKWLQDPQAVRPGTGMPNLHLSPAEIDALIAFLNS